MIILPSSFHQHISVYPLESKINMQQLIEGEALNQVIDVSVLVINSFMHRGGSVYNFYGSKYCYVIGKMWFRFKAF